MRRRANIGRGICLFLTFFAISVSSAQADAGEWTIFSAPTPAFTTEAKLAAVSCTSSTACTAVGFHKGWGTEGKDALAERWNGESWTSELPPNPVEGDIALDGVSCSTSTDCIAVGGTYTEVAGFTAAAERREGSSWKLESPPEPAGALESKLEAVSCTSASACTAVGHYKNGSEELLPLVERWDGSKWAIQTTPALEGEEAALTGVSCRAASECVAVGSYEVEGEAKPLIERWDGKAWAVESAPLPEGALGAVLQGVSCESSSGFCIAAGSYENVFGLARPLAERWQGSWTVESTPNAEGAEEASFDGVSCPLKWACTATGSSKASSTQNMFVERQSTFVWNQQSPASPSGTEPTLPAVSCPSSTYCMLVGSYKNGSGVILPLTERHVLKSPVNSTKPTASPSSPETGKAVTATDGTWTETPYRYEYQWKRCNASGLECVNISGQTSSTYYPLAADIEKTLVVEVKAFNDAGNGSATSAATGKVKKAGLVTEYATAMWAHPRGIAPGPDENLWFTSWGGDKVSKITTSGTITEYSTGGGNGWGPIGIAKGPDGNLWFSLESASSRVGKITTSGTPTKYELAKPMEYGREIAKGPDGNLWFTATEGRVGKITTSGTFTSYEVTGEPTGIAEGPDGNLWLTKRSANKISKMTTGGTVTDYSLPSATSPYGIVTGPDEKLWFGADGKIGKISTAGTITEYSLPVAGEVKGIAEGPDGLLWFAHYGADRIGKITTGGTITEYSLPPGSKPWDVAAGPDGNVWFTLSGSHRIGMIEP